MSVPEGAAYVLCHAAGATVVKWCEARGRIADMDVLKDFLSAHLGPRLDARTFLLTPFVEDVQIRAYRWADDYNSTGPRRERALQEARS